MTNDAKVDTKKGQENMPAAVGQVAVISPQAIITTPMILKLGRSSKKSSSKKYTRGTKVFQRLALGVSKAAFRSTNSVAKGLETFAKDSNKSARKRRDGMIRDSLRNASNGVSEGFTELGKAPGEIARRVSSGQVWRTVRIFTPLGR